MKILLSPYLLQKKLSLNAKDATATQAGTLIKVVDGDHWGVADLCPHPELGDLSLAEEIQSKGALFTRGMELALEDLQARKNKVSLLDSRAVINNYLITDYREHNLNQALYSGQTIKIKGHTDIIGLSEKINEIHIETTLRLDFNSVLDANSFESFLNLLKPEAIEKIQYIEDPVPFCSQWEGWNKRLSLAYDFQKSAYSENSATYRIIKPSREKVLTNLKNFTLTSAMEHPVGLAHGLRIAQQVAQNTSGFLTLDLFERTAFHRYFLQSGSALTFSSEALADDGIGMNAELDKLSWVEA